MLLKKTIMTLIVASLWANPLNVMGQSETMPDKHTVDKVEKAIDSVMSHAAKKITMIAREEMAKDIKKMVQIITEMNSKELVLNGMSLGKTMKPKIDDKTKIKDLGMFKEFQHEGLTYRIYVGPTKENADVLRRQGLSYSFKENELVYMQLTKGKEKTNKNITIGSYRGEVLYRYGTPQGIWRIPKDHKVIFIYATPKDEKAKAPLSRKDYQYLFITIEKSQVSQLDFIDGQILSDIAFDVPKLVDFKKGELRDEDFVLHGKRLGEFVFTDEDTDWRYRGNFKNYKFTSYDQYLLTYNHANILTGVTFLDSEYTTPRGVGVGDTAFVLQSAYGSPPIIKDQDPDYEKLFQHSQNVGQKEILWIYPHPKKTDLFLVFTIDAKENYVTSVELTDLNLYEKIKKEIISEKAKEESRHKTIAKKNLKDDSTASYQEKEDMKK